MKNKKGITIVEIIVSIALISVVLIVLFRLLILLRNNSAITENKSAFLLNQSLITEAISDKFNEKGVTNNPVKTIASDHVTLELTESNVSIEINSITCTYSRIIDIDVYEDKLESYEKYNTSTSGCSSFTKTIINRNMPNNGIYKLDDIEVETNCISTTSNNSNNIFTIRIPVYDKKNNSYDILVSSTFKTGSC